MNAVGSTGSITNSSNVNFSLSQRNVVSGEVILTKLPSHVERSFISMSQHLRNFQHFLLEQVLFLFLKQVLFL